MCHPVFPVLPLQLPGSLQFLLHPWSQHLPPAQCQHPTQHLGSKSSTKRTDLCHHPQIPPIEVYILVVEQASSKLPAQEVDEFRSDVNKLLKQQQQSQCNNQCNLNPTQCRALTQLKQDISKDGTHSGQGGAMVIMDQEDYTNKAKTLLQDTNTYKVLKKDPTSHLKNKLISLLKDIKQTGGLSTNKYKQLYPTSAVPPSSMAFPKFTK